MAHPYKSYEENRHGRAVAKKRGYQSGGVVSFPGTLKDADSQRLRSVQGVASGRISPVSRDNVVAGPGRFPGSGAIKPSRLRTMAQDKEEYGAFAKGGKVEGAIPGKKGKRLTGGADSGVGRMELAKRAAKRR